MCQIISKTTTWASAFAADLTREKEVTAAKIVRASAALNSAGDDEAQHAFDFDLGTCKTHSTRLLHPLTGSKEWVDLDGVSVVKKVWDGKANLAEYKADGPVAGHLELMELRWFNPTTHEWNIDFATPNAGVFGAVPGRGSSRMGVWIFMTMS